MSHCGRVIPGAARIAAAVILLLPGFGARALARNAVPETPELNPKGRRQAVTVAAPVFHRRAHFVGEVWASFANDGHWGSNHADEACRDDEQLLRINWCPSFEFPGGSRIDYLFNGGLWIGGIVGADTLVSLGYEGWSETGDEFNGFFPMATEPPPGYTSGCGVWGENRRLEQTYYCVYSDTTLTARTSASHTPMGLEVTQVTHQASDNFARSFVIVDLQIENIGPNTIRDMYLSVFNDCDVFWTLQGGGQNNATDDISGFLATWPNPVDSKFDDTLNIAWSADNDGDVENGLYPLVAPRGAMGWRILRQPEGTHLSYNWWTSDAVALQDWGPRRSTDLRDLGHGGRGTPTGPQSGRRLFAPLLPAQHPGPPIDSGRCCRQHPLHRGRPQSPARFLATPAGPHFTPLRQEVLDRGQGRTLHPRLGDGRADPRL